MGNPMVPQMPVTAQEPSEDMDQGGTQSSMPKPNPLNALKPKKKKPIKSIQELRAIASKMKKPMGY